MREYRTRRLLKLVISLLLLVSSPLYASTADKTVLYFSALTPEGWRIVMTNPGDKRYRPLPTAVEAREFAYSPRRQALIYIGSDLKLRRLDEARQKESVLYTPTGRDLLAQPVYDDERDTVYLVFMPSGKSSEADIVAWKNGEIRPAVAQVSSQFEPFLHKPHWLYYGHVHCTTACGGIIQEIWVKNLVSGEARQVTLLGKISRQPFVSPDGAWLYFSSNKDGHYHIWRQALPNGRAERVTSGNNADSDPVVTSDGILYFIRRSGGQSRLMRLDPRGRLETIELPAAFQDLRNLRLYQP